MAIVSDSHAIYFSNVQLAVLRFTPTAFTVSSTFSSSLVANSFWSTSCWYWPTQIAFGSILVSSASASCALWAILILHLTVTSKSGYSLCASLLALYTDAPASLTTIYLAFRLCFLISSHIYLLDSRLAVPFPITISSTPNFFIISNNFASSRLWSESGSDTYTTSLCKNLPVVSTIAILQPVRNPGSNHITTNPRIGGVSSSCFIFSPKILIAASSARCFLSDLISRIILGIVSLSRPSFMDSDIYITELLKLSCIYIRAAKLYITSSEYHIFTVNCFSSSALLIAKYA